MIRSGHNFAHAMTAQIPELSWHVQNCDIIFQNNWDKTFCKILSQAHNCESFVKWLHDDMSTILQ